MPRIASLWSTLLFFGDCFLLTFVLDFDREVGEKPAGLSSSEALAKLPDKEVLVMAGRNTGEGRLGVGEVIRRLSGSLRRREMV